MKQCPSNWQLSKMHQGLMPHSEKTELTCHVAECALCQERLHQLQQDISSALNDPRAQELSKQLAEAWPTKEKHAKSPTTKEEKTSFSLKSWLEQRLWLTGGALLASAMCAVLLFGYDIHSFDKKHDVSGQWRGKSRGLHVSLLYSHPNQKSSFLAKRKQRLYPGDLIQFTYRFSYDAHVMVVSLHETGKIEKYVPFSTGSKSMFVQAGQGSWPSSSALELDDRLGHERIIIAIAKKPFSFSSLKQALQNAYKKSHQFTQKLDLPLGRWRTKTLMIQKVRKSKGGKDE